MSTITRQHNRHMSSLLEQDIQKGLRFTRLDSIIYETTAKWLLWYWPDDYRDRLNSRCISLLYLWSYMNIFVRMAKRLEIFGHGTGVRFFGPVSPLYFNNPALLQSYSQALIKLYDYADIKRHRDIHLQIFGMNCGTYTTQVASRGNSVATKTTQTIW